MGEEKSVTFKVGGWISSFTYLACGMLYHLVTSDVAFSWNNPWLYVDMALWPFWLFGWFILLVIAIFVCVGLLFGGASIMDSIDRRKNRRAFAQRAEEERRRLAQATPPKS